MQIVAQTNHVRTINLLAINCQRTVEILLLTLFASILAHAVHVAVLERTEEEEQLRKTIQ